MCDHPAARPVPDDLAAAIVAARPRLGPFGARVLFFDLVSSTNDIADRLALAGAPEGTVVVADAQRAGRGRLGRGWFSPAGAGLYVSIVLRPTLGPAGSVNGTVQPAAVGASVTLVAGAALCEALRRATGLPIEIKWPNDLLISGRKICGILTEASGVGDALQHAVLGFGVNLRSAAFPRELADRATSVEGELGRHVDRGVVLAEALASLAECYTQLRAGRIATILARWRALAPSSTGVTVRFENGGRSKVGTTAGIDADGALLVRTPDGVERVIAGDVTWIGAADRAGTLG